MGAGGAVVWITGLSGAGKSTLARRVADRLRGEGVPVLLLDGNQVRDAIDDPRVGFDVKSRRAAAYRMSRLAALAEAQGLVAVVATIALFHEVQEWNRLHLDNYVEVYVRAPLDLVRARDAQGVYAARARRAGGAVWGIDIPIEEPRTPDLVIERSDRAGGADEGDAVERVAALLRRRRPDPASAAP